MKAKILLVAITVFVVAGAVIGFALLGPSVLTRSGGIGAQVNTAVTPYPADANPIVRENALPGSAAWQIPQSREAKTQIQAYASATSVAPGGKISFYVSTQQDGTHYKIEIFRLGWYQGLGGRLIYTVPDVVGHAQGYFDPTANRLVGCNNCINTTNQPGLIEAKWNNPVVVPIDPLWLSGVYIAKFTDANGWQTYYPFDVLPATQNSTYVAVTPDTTYAAENTWGGAGLNFASNDVRTMFAGQANLFTSGGGMPYVSLDRPYTMGNGSPSNSAADTFLYVYQMVRWMEHQGYDVSYISDVDLHEHGNWLLTHKAYISLGHDEYWTLQMYDAVQGARDKGVGLAFMGADVAHWHMRFQPDYNNTKDRTVVSYQVTSQRNDLKRDPTYTAPTVFNPLPNNADVTSAWDDPGRANLQFGEKDNLNYRPPQQLVGQMLSDQTRLYAPGYPWQVSQTADPNSILLKGTGLVPGKSYGCGIVGDMWDTINHQFPSPVQNVHVLSESPAYSDLTHQTPKSDSTYYIAQSGALVFSSGSLYFTSALDGYRSPDLNQNTSPHRYCGKSNTNVPDLRGVPGMTTQDMAIPGIQAMMQNVMNALPTKHAPNS